MRRSHRAPAVCGIFHGRERVGDGYAAPDANAGAHLDRYGDSYGDVDPHHYAHYYAYRYTHRYAVSNSSCHPHRYALRGSGRAGADGHVSQPHPGLGSTVSRLPAPLLWAE